MKVDILVIGVYFDDVELSCSGILLWYMDQGKIVGLFDFICGELGIWGIVEIRDQEVVDVVELLGVLFRKNLEMEDGFFVYNLENIKKIIVIIWEYQLEIVFCNVVDDWYFDYGWVVKFIVDVCFYLGLVKILIYDVEGNLYEWWWLKVVYYYIQDFNLKLDFVVDIFEYME